VTDLLADAAIRLRGARTTPATSSLSGRVIAYPKRAGRPRSGNKVGTGAAITRTSSGDPRRARAPQAPRLVRKSPPLARPIAPDAVLLDLRQVGVMLGGLSLAAVRGLVARGKLVPAALGVRRVLISRQQVEALAR